MAPCPGPRREAGLRRLGERRLTASVWGQRPASSQILQALLRSGWQAALSSLRITARLSEGALGGPRPAKQGHVPRTADSEPQLPKLLLYALAICCFCLASSTVEWLPGSMAGG